MPSRTTMPDARLLRRRCVSCGYDGALLRDGSAPRCARCGCDLRRRPARSYLEMEGFPGPRRRAGDPLRESRLIYRWIAFLFLAIVGLITVVYLSAAAFSV